MGGFDPLIVGAGLREQLIPPAHLKRVSRTAGWISPVVLVDGVVAGVWDATTDRRAITITVDPFLNVSPALRTRISVAAERVGDALGLAVELGYGRAFREKKRAQPFSDR